MTRKLAGDVGEDAGRRLPAINDGELHAVGDAMEITWNPETRIAGIRFEPGTKLGGGEAALMVGSLTRWVGDGSQRFALLVDTKGVTGADSTYRAKTRDFFKLHRHSAFVAVTNMGPVIRVVAEMFRIATGMQLKGFGDETSARAWLRSVGIEA